MLAAYLKAYQDRRSGDANRKGKADVVKDLKRVLGDLDILRKRVDDVLSTWHKLYTGGSLPDVATIGRLRLPLPIEVLDKNYPALEKYLSKYFKRGVNCRNPSGGGVYASFPITLDYLKEQIQTILKNTVVLVNTLNRVGKDAQTEPTFETTGGKSLDGKSILLQGLDWSEGMITVCKALVDYTAVCIF